MNLEQWLIEEVGHERPRPGLDRLSSYMPARFEKIKKLNPTIVTIAGTNGKGQTAMGLATLFSFEKVSFTLWTSPHIESMSERFYSSRGNILEEKLKFYLENILQEKEHLQISLTYYEVLFLAFVDFTIDLSPEVMILEVGLGGRLDAVNLFAAHIVAITSLSRDHQEFLGNRFDQILSEKYGVAKTGSQLFTALESKYLREKLLDWTTRDKVHFADLFENGELSTQDDYLVRNRKLTLKLAECFFKKIDRKLQQDHWGEKLEKTDIKARMEKWTSNGATILFNGGHNLDGIRKLIQKIQSEDYNLIKIDVTLFSFSKRNPGELDHILKLLKLNESVFGQIYLSKFDHTKATDWELSSGSYPFKLVKWQNYLEEAIAEKKYILVSGSYYFVGEIQKYLRLRFPDIHFSADIC